MILRIVLLLLLSLSAAFAQSGAPLGSGYLSVSGNQFVDGTGRNVRIAATTYRGAPTSLATMQAIRSAGFNTIRLDWQDAWLNSATGSGTCKTLTELDQCVSTAGQAGLKVILSHLGNEIPTSSSSACNLRQPNGLWFDSGGSSGNSDGCGVSGYYTYAQFKSDTVSLLQRYANNSTVIGYQLHKEPLVVGSFTGQGGTGSGSFSVANGQIIGPSGQPFSAYGVNITDDELSSATPSAVTSLFPKLNMVRLAVGADCGPPQFPSAGFGCMQPYSTIENWTSSMTAQNVVVMIESHECNGGSPNANQIDAGQEFTFYNTLAAFFKNNPYVWFESGNECGTPGITAENQNVYNAVRNAGNNTIVAFEVSFANGPPDGPASTYNPMNNVIWTPHAYNNATNGQTNQTTVNSIFSGWVNSGATYTTEQGSSRIPSLFSEVGFIDYFNVCGGPGGPGTGTNTSCGTTQVVTAALSPGSVNANDIGGLIWLWGYPPCCHQQTDLTNLGSPPARTNYGDYVNNLLNANSPGPTPSGGGGSGTFTVSNSKLIGPDGNPFVAYGLNVCDNTMTTASGNDTLPKIDVALLQSLMPHINFVRLAVGCDANGWPSAQSFTAIENWVTAVTAQHIVVEIESHVTGQPQANTIDLNGEASWYATLAGFFKSNPYVWFGTGNELGPTGLTAEHQNVYNAVRNQGNSSIIMLCMPDGNPMVNGFTPDGPASAYNAMTNVIWDQHWYNWMTNGSTNTTTINTTLNSDISTGQGYTTESGGQTIPVLLGEMGMDNIQCGGNVAGGCGAAENTIVGMSPKPTNLNVPGMGQENLAGNTSVGFGYWLAWFVVCCDQGAAFELDANPVTLTTTSSIRTVPIGQIVALYVLQGPGPVSGGGGGGGTANPAVSWGGGGDTDILAACSDVGAAVNAVNAGAILFCPAPLNNGVALLNGGAKP